MNSRERRVIRKREMEEAKRTLLLARIFNNNQNLVETVNLGDMVDLHIVGPNYNETLSLKLSNNNDFNEAVVYSYSPIGIAIMGKNIGSSVEIELNDGKYLVNILGKSTIKTRN